MNTERDLEHKKKYKYLLDINSPVDLRKLNSSDLPAVCNELREFMVDTITQSGGHFGSGLGVVELTVALHYIFNTPHDKLVFDTGHQGYPHKILTGRRDQLNTIRKKDGLSGFLKRSESVYDAYEAGHASTSISAALGMATARDLLDKDYRVVSIIGDGAMTGGLAFEAMNNCGVQNRDITVILNDNNVSISQNVSAFSNYFNRLFASATAQKIRDNVWELTGRMDEFGDRLRKVASRIEDGVKAIVTPGILFEALGFKYFGPIDGNNVTKMVRLLKLIKDIKGPVFLHLITQKGKGYEPAENDTYHLHAIGRIDKKTGKSYPGHKNSLPKYQDVFGHALTEICGMNDKVVGITAAMPEGTGINILEEKYPEKVFDVGIAEGHAVTFASGLANEGIIPVVAIYSSFLQRAYDMLAHDCALQGQHVVFALDRAGLVGSDGPTHHGVLDISCLRPIQNIVLMAPKDEQELRDMLYTAINGYNKGPVAIRYPRGRGMGTPTGPMKLIEIGKSDTLSAGSDIAIIAYGKMVAEAVKAGTILERYDISAEIVNARFAKPLDSEMLDDIANRFDHVITVEDGQAAGGFGAGILEYYNENSGATNLVIIGIPNKFVDHGTQEELHHDLGMDAEGIALKALNILGIEYIPESESHIIEK